MNHYVLLYLGRILKYNLFTWDKLDAERVGCRFRLLEPAEAAIFSTAEAAVGIACADGKVSYADGKLPSA